MAHTRGNVDHFAVGSHGAAPIHEGLDAEFDAAEMLQVERGRPEEPEGEDVFGLALCVEGDRNLAQVAIEAKNGLSRGLVRSKFDRVGREERLVHQLLGHYAHTHGLELRLDPGGGPVLLAHVLQRVPGLEDVRDFQLLLDKLGSGDALVQGLDLSLALALLQDRRASNRGELFELREGLSLLLLVLGLVDHVETVDLRVQFGQHLLLSLLELELLLGGLLSEFLQAVLRMSAPTPTWGRIDTRTAEEKTARLADELDRSVLTFAALFALESLFHECLSESVPPPPSSRSTHRAARTRTHVLETSSTNSMAALCTVELLLMLECIVTDLAATHFNY